MLATPLFLPAQELRAVSPLENQANGSLAVSEVVANLVAGNAERAKALQSYTGRRTYRLDYHGPWKLAVRNGRQGYLSSSVDKEIYCHL